MPGHFERMAAFLKVPITMDEVICARYLESHRLFFGLHFVFRNVETAAIDHFIDTAEAQFPTERSA